MWSDPLAALPRMLIPYEIETLMDRRPWVNWVIIALCVLVSVGCWYGAIPHDLANEMVLQSDWTPQQFFTYVLLHRTWIHLLGNMVFLWVFGNALCANIESWLYTALFWGSAIVAGTVHLIMSGTPVIGASGAVNGIVGLVLAIYPMNRVSVLWWLFGFHQFQVRAYVVILWWFVFDVLDAFSKPDGIAYWSHVGGLLFGVSMGMICLHYGLIRTTEWDNETLLELLKGEQHDS